MTKKKDDDWNDEVHVGAKTRPSISIVVREDEIFTGEESVFTLKFPDKKKMQVYFPKFDVGSHQFFVKTDVKKPVKTRIIVRVVHPETNKIMVMYAKITKYGTHPTKADQKGLYYQIIHMDSDQEKTIYDFIA